MKMNTKITDPLFCLQGCRKKDSGFLLVRVGKEEVLYGTEIEV